jgi:kynureninase
MKAPRTVRAKSVEADLLAWRKEFPVLQESTYLVSHSMGAMPRSARVRLKQYCDDWASQGVDAYNVWLPRLRETADRVGLLFNAPPGTVAFHQNVSTLMSVIISAIAKPGGRTKVVYTDLNFPSIHYNWLRNEELGLRVHLVGSPDGIEIPTEKIVGALDDETLAVVLDHGIFRSGYLQDVASIARAARDKGVITIVDAYQTIGCVPIDVQDWGIEFLVGGSHKWLCGGPGASFLYARKDLIPSLRPRVTGWFSHKHPFAFDMDLEYADDAMRFATGTPNMPGIHAASAGIEIIAKVGVDRIREKSVRLTSRLIEMAEEEGLTVNSPRDSSRRTGLVCIDFPGADKAEKELLRRKVQVDYRPRCGLRISPHFYTTDEELFSVVPTIRKVRKKL